MKSQFLVSACREALPAGVKNIYVADPFIYHVLSREGRLSEFSSVEVGPVYDPSRDNLQSDHDDVDGRHTRYLALLIPRINQVLGCQHGELFWKQLLSVPLVKHIGMCYAMFWQCERQFDARRHSVLAMRQDAFRVPLTFDEHRHYLQHTEMGQEQLFAVYCELFLDGPVERFGTCAPAPADGATATSDGTGTPRRSLGERLHPKRLLRKLLRQRHPRLGVLNSYFSAAYMDHLLWRSLGRIQPLSLPALSSDRPAPDLKARAYLTEWEDDFDRFDQFCMRCLYHLWPVSMLEGFGPRLMTMQQFFQKQQGLRWVVSEAWPADDATSLALAVLRESGVRQMYNEHNYLAVPFVGNHLKYIAAITDEFLTLGWNDSDLPNLVPAASLFPWYSQEARPVPDINLLLVGGLPQARCPEIGSSWGDAGARGARQYLNATKGLLEALGADLRAKTYFRAYPRYASRNWAVWDQRYEFGDVLQSLAQYDDDSVVSASQLMRRARLVIVNYLSTAHLESLLANIPTVLLWNASTNCFSRKYEDIFDGLRDAGICHTDPAAAGAFIRSIAEDPEAWWGSANTQAAKTDFLQRFFGHQSTMLAHLITRAKQ
ncbi:MAG TPA: LIC12162 family protein [Rhodocyclaceae bacterium]|jgi:putative transferase (TIGR04331 family)